MSSAADDWVVIPPGVAHGFLALEPLQMSYLVTNEHDGTDELGFAWDDPAVGVAWPPVPGTPSTVARSSRTAIAPAPAWPNSRCVSATRRPDRTTPCLPAPHRVASERTRTLGTIPRLSAARSAQTLQTGLITLHRSPDCAESVVVLVFAMLAALGAFAPVASAAAPVNPKVVIIVGATHGATSGYRAAADKAYAEARKYTTNVVKVYSPNATWSKVKAATKGASIVVYLGHGNGWPSPYTYDPTYTTKDGFGLNSSAGNGDSNVKYYGEPYVSTLELAPNAVVILNRLCYASGNSEPGDADPSQTTARKRVDNFAAGFLKAARAVIADGHGSAEPYIRALFTTHATIQEVWEGAPNFHDHVKTFASSRTSGATAYTDTDSTTSGYYRSLVTRPGLTSDDVTGASYADTGVDPPTLQVPGNASVGDLGASLYDDAGQPAGSVPAGTRLRVVAPGNTISAVGAASVLVEGVDDPSITGWMAVPDLLPRDSAAPAVWGLDAATFSPNGDGRSDTGAVSGRFSETVDWRVRILDGDTVLDETTGSGDDFSITWDGLDGGTALPDGDYDVEIEAQDAWGNGPTTKTTSIEIDTVGATLAAVGPAADEDRWFSPNGDLSRESLAWTAGMTEPGSLVLHVYDGDGQRVRIFAQPADVGTSTLTWDGRDDDGHWVPDGTYEVRVTPRDLTGTSGTAAVRSVRVDTTLGFVDTTKILFYPHDNDTLAPTTTLSYTLTRAATVTWVIKDASGTVVDTLLDAVPTEPGTYTQVYDGTRTDLPRLPTGLYSSEVSATDGTTTVVQTRGFRMMAFHIVPSDSTPKRGQKISLTVTTGRAPVERRAALRLPARQGSLGRHVHQDLVDDVQGHDHAQDGWWRWDREAQGLRRRRAGPAPEHHAERRQPLIRARPDAIRPDPGGPRARPAADPRRDRRNPTRPHRTGPHRDHLPIVRASSRAYGRGMHHRSARPFLLLIAALAAGLLPSGVAAAEPSSTHPSDPAPDLRPSVHYEDALAHAHDRIAFQPGGRVSVPFRPRATDTWVVGGQPPTRPSRRPTHRSLDPRPGRREPLPRRPADHPTVRHRRHARHRLRPLDRRTDVPHDGRGRIRAGSAARSSASSRTGS